MIAVERPVKFEYLVEKIRKLYGQELLINYTNGSGDVSKEIISVTILKDLLLECSKENYIYCFNKNFLNFLFYF